MELRDYLRIIRRRWLLIVSCAALVVGAAAAWTFTTTPQYASSARLFISSPQTGNTADAYQGGLFSQQRVQSYADLATGVDLAQRVTDKLQLSETPQSLAGQISSRVIPETIILEVTATDPSPGRAQLLARTTAEEFTTYVSELEKSPGLKSSPIKATIVDTADLPTSPVSPRPLRNLGLALIVGLVLGFGIAVLREHLDTTVKSAQTLSLYTGAAVLGTVGYDSKAAKTPLVTELDSHAPRVEAFRMLRTNLQFIDVDQPPKVFVVTSAVPGEGKTTTAINLALTIAQANQQVMLIEGDLRRPRVSEYLRLEPTVGLTTVLVGTIDIDDAIQPWGDSGLDVVTGGTIPPNPAELLQSQTMQTTIDKLRGRYDFVIIDAPPLLPVTDAAVLATQADGAILVARYGHTTKEQAAEAVSRLGTVDARTFGTVLNMVPARGADGYGYGYGYAPLAGPSTGPA